MLAGTVALAVSLEADGEQGSATLSPRLQRCCCGRVWYTYVSDFMVMHFYHQHHPKPFISAEHLEKPCLPPNMQLCFPVQGKRHTSSV